MSEKETMPCVPRRSVILQNRWRVVRVDGKPYLLYYGVRNPPLHRMQRLDVSENLAALLSDEGVDVSRLTPTLSQEVQRLVELGVLVQPEEKRREQTPETMQVCVHCVNNDYVIPGLEFDENGVCALCQCYAQTRAPSHSVFTTVTESQLLAAAQNNTLSRFDAMVLYTGGKDSSYMLWLLARKLKLRVLAAFWNMPYCSEAAYANIQRAKAHMREVEFVEWTLPLGLVREAMCAKWHTHGWPCLCPTAAFPTLYPLAAHLKIPYVFLGLEDVQAAVLDYVFSPPAAANANPTPREQTLAFLAARALPRPQKPPYGWAQEMSNYHAAVNGALPSLFAELAALVQRAQTDPGVFMPLIGRLSTNREYGTWDDARTLIAQEMGWQAPVGQNSLLHTSCAIEPVKAYLPFQRFRSMRTVFMPQSLGEMGAAVFFGLTPRSEALRAVEELGYWKKPAILDQLAADLGITPDDVQAADDELPGGMADWAAETKGHKNV